MLLLVRYVVACAWLQCTASKAVLTSCSHNIRSDWELFTKDALLLRGLSEKLCLLWVYTGFQTMCTFNFVRLAWHRPEQPTLHTCRTRLMRFSRYSLFRQDAYAAAPCLVLTCFTTDPLAGTPAIKHTPKSFKYFSHLSNKEIIIIIIMSTITKGSASLLWRRDYCSYLHSPESFWTTSVYRILGRGLCMARTQVCKVSASMQRSYISKKFCCTFSLRSGLSAVRGRSARWKSADTSLPPMPDTRAILRC